MNTLKINLSHLWEINKIWYKKNWKIKKFIQICKIINIFWLKLEELI
jgi:hypothetical protein